MDGQNLALGLHITLIGCSAVRGAGCTIWPERCIYQAGISESAMPTAVVMTVLATEYDIEPSFITTVVFMSTLLSPLTITPLLAYLGA
jgi:predicted permease